MIRPITVLKIKAKIYRYAGIYLAHKEENDYLGSKEFWDKFCALLTHPENDLSMRGAQGLLIGIWQADHGFARPYKFKKR